MQKARLHEIDTLTGVAIILVVFGHLANPDASPMMVGSSFYFLLKQYIYMFHMPLFMFLSGVVFYYTLPLLTTRLEYTLYIKQKFIRLIPPFLLFGTIILLGKTTLSGVIHVEHFNPTAISSHFYNILFAPMSSFARSLWYIYVLFEYYVVFALILPIFKHKIYLLPLIGIVLYFSGISNHFLALNQFTHYFIFFAFGVLFISQYEKFKTNFITYRHMYMIMFLFSFSLIDKLNPKYYLLIIGTLSIMALYGYIHSYLKQNTFFTFISKYTFSIYLMNMIFIGLIEAILLKFIPLTGYTFNGVFTIIVFLTIASIIIIKKYCFKFIPILDKMTK